MNKLFLAPLVIILSIIILISCGKKDYETPEEVVNANAEYMNKEDLDAVMTTIHPESPSYPATEAMAKQIFDRYDLNYKIENVKVLEENATEAKVEFTQLTTKIKGPEFHNNRTVGIHTLRKDGNSWKVYSTEMVKVDLLDQDGFHN